MTAADTYDFWTWEHSQAFVMLDYWRRRYLDAKTSREKKRYLPLMSEYQLRQSVAYEHLYHWRIRNVQSAI